MFLNHHRYYWVLDVLPPCELQYTSSYNVDAMIGEISYTTPTMKNGRTLTLENGMRIKFAPHTVDRFTQTNSANTTFTSTLTNGDKYKVFLNNNLQTVTTHYTINNVVVTFVSSPAVNSEIEIHVYYQYSGGGKKDPTDRENLARKRWLLSFENENS